MRMLRAANLSDAMELLHAGYFGAPHRAREGGGGIGSVLRHVIALIVGDFRF